MAKYINDDVMTAALQALDDATILFICSAAPSSYSDASATVDLVTHVLTPGDGNGDFTIADGSTSGKKLTLGAQSGLTVDHSGTSNYWAIGISASSKLLAYGDITSPQALTAGNTVNLAAFIVDEIRDPS
jgi:hypothetical protein